MGEPSQTKKLGRMRSYLMCVYCTRVLVSLVRPEVWEAGAKGDQSCLTRLQSPLQRYRSRAKIDIITYMQRMVYL